MKIYRKYLVIGIMILFVGASILPVIGTKELKSMFLEIETALVKSESGKLADSDWYCECNIWVDDNNTEGPWDGTQEHPYQYIQDAIDNADSEDCICVMNGTYYENITIEGESKNGITLCGEDRDTTIIDAQNKNETNTVSIAYDTDVTICNFTVIGSGLDHDYDSYEFDGIYCEYSKTTHIYNNVIRDNGNGIHGFHDTFLKIENNIIIDNFDNGIRDRDYCIVKYNYLANNGYGPIIEPNGDGIEIQASAQPSVISDNIITNNKIDGIWIETVDVHRITRNTISNNGKCGIHIKEGNSNTISDNNITNNEYGLYLWLGSFSNKIIDNEIVCNDDSKGGISLIGGGDNEISRNNITGMGIGSPGCPYGIRFIQEMGGTVTKNVIAHFRVGILLYFTLSIEINYNSITDCELLLLSLVSGGDARWNWWGSALFGPYGRMLRIPPFSPIVFPWIT